MRLLFLNGLYATLVMRNLLMQSAKHSNCSRRPDEKSDKDRTEEEERQTFSAYPWTIPDSTNRVQTSRPKRFGLPECSALKSKKARVRVVCVA